MSLNISVQFEYILESLMDLILVLSTKINLQRGFLENYRLCLESTFNHKEIQMYKSNPKIDLYLVSLFRTSLFKTIIIYNKKNNLEEFYKIGGRTGGVWGLRPHQLYYFRKGQFCPVII